MRKIDSYAVREAKREPKRLRRERSKERIAEKDKGKQRVFLKNHIGKRHEYNEAHAKCVCLSKKYGCNPCGTNSQSQADLNRHFTTVVHKKKIIRVVDSRQLQHRYYLCYKSIIRVAQSRQLQHRKRYRESLNKTTQVKEYNQIIRFLYLNPGSHLQISSGFHETFSKYISSFESRRRDRSAGIHGPELPPCCRCTAKERYERTYPRSQNKKMTNQCRIISGSFRSDGWEIKRTLNNLCTWDILSSFTESRLIEGSVAPSKVVVRAKEVALGCLI
jgi:hypothetical protein